MCKKTGKPGSVSSATMLVEDLIPTFLSELDDLDPKTARSLRWEYRRILRTIDGFGAWCRFEGKDADEAHWLTDALFDALGDCAPEDHYFGAHEGDGADYGFWQHLPEFWDDD